MTVSLATTHIGDDYATVGVLTNDTLTAEFEVPKELGEALEQSNASAHRWNAVYIRTQNDRNGNPRRGWAIQCDGAFVTFLDEGYAGNRETVRKLRDAYHLPEPLAIQVIQEAMWVQVAPAEYSTFVKNGKSMDKFGEIR